MRLWMILGGQLGFLISLSIGVAQGSAWPNVIWRASVAAFAGGIILRWWGGIWMKSLRQAQHDRRSAADKMEPASLARKAQT
ncbi:MAG TPA: hypothetical protein VGK40_04200 [Verrucomicrobiae bacterium]